MVMLPVEETGVEGNSTRTRLDAHSSQGSRATCTYASAKIRSDCRLGLGGDGQEMIKSFKIHTNMH